MEVKATLVYIVDGNKTLMIHRNKKEGDEHKGKYNGLGGKLESGESPEQCAIREVKEESGLDISNLIFKGDILFPEFDKYGRDWRVYIYRTHSFSGELIRSNHEGDLEWVDTDKILGLNLWEGDKLFLPLVFTEKTFKGSLFYRNGNLDESQEQILDIIGS